MSGRDSRIPQMILTLLLMAAATPVVADEAVDATGTWNLNVTDQGRTFTPSFTLGQQGEELSGTYRNSRGELPASGTIDGNVATLNVKVKGRDGQERTVVYTGTIEGDTFTGKVLTSRGEATFVGERSGP